MHDAAPDNHAQLSQEYQKRGQTSLYQTCDKETHANPQYQS